MATNVDIIRDRLDAFDRPNNSSAGPNWSNSLRPVDTATFGILNGRGFRSSGAGTLTAWYNAASFNAAQRAFVSIKDMNNYTGVYTRLLTPGTATVRGYAAYQINQQVEMYRLDNGAFVTLAPTVTNVPWTDGDYLMLESIGVLHTVYRYSVSRNEWTQIGVWTDGTYTGGGFVGIELDGSATIEDFGGANYVADTPLSLPSNPTYSMKVAWGGNVLNGFTLGTSTLGGGDQLTGTFNVGFDGPYDDVTLDLEDFVVDRGRDDPLTTMQSGKCEFTLFDPTGKYNPLSVSSPIAGQMIPMRQVKLTATTEDGVVYPLFRGFIRSMDYDPVTYRTKVVAEDLFLFLDRAKPIISAASITTGALIQQILTAAGWTLSQLTSVDVTKGDTVNSFSMLGTSDARSALGGIADLLEAERGIFFIKADGTARYEDRYTYATKASTQNLADVFLNTFPGTSIDNVKNRARVTRTAGVQQESFNQASIDVYGANDIAIESDYFTSDAVALQLAKSLVATYANPAAPVWALPLVGNYDLSVLTACLQVEIGDRVTVTSTQGGFSGDFFVESIKHVSRSAAYHQTELALTRRPYGQTGAAELFTFGTSTLGGGSILAYY